MRRKAKRREIVALPFTQVRLHRSRGLMTYREISHVCPLYYINGDLTEKHMDIDNTSLRINAFKTCVFI